MLARQTSAKLKRGEAFEPRLPQKAGLRNRLSVPPNYFPFAFIPDVLAASTLGIATPDWRKHAADLEAEMLRRGDLRCNRLVGGSLQCRARSVDQAVLKPVTVKNLAAGPRHPYAVPRTLCHCVCTRRRSCIGQLSPFLEYAPQAAGIKRLPAWTCQPSGLVFAVAGVRGAIEAEMHQR
jgi:hypothetical protein